MGRTVAGGHSTLIAEREGIHMPLSGGWCRASVFSGLVTLGIMVRCLARRRKLVCWNSTVKLNIVAPLVPASDRIFHQGGGQSRTHGSCFGGIELVLRAVA